MSTEPTPTPTQPAVPSSTAFENILNILQEATVIAGLVAPLTGPLAGEVALGSQIALSLENIIENAAAAYEAALGTPMDLTKLHAIEPLP